MALSGLLVPAKEATVGFFSSFFTDITDDQSLEDSISTFSSHIKKINNIFQNADEKSLILIDELGSGTNPEEGAALAQAVVEKLINLKSKLIITTHLNKLKIFASQHPQCKNASMRFDEKNLKPTYILDVGFPGNSYALDIAKEYKISEDILFRAKEILDNKSLELGYILKTTEKQRNTLSRKIFEYELKNKLIQDKLKSISEKEKNWDKIEKKKKKAILEKEEEELANLYLQLEKELKNLKRKIKKTQKIDRVKIKQFKQKIHKRQAKIIKKKEDISDLKLIPMSNPKSGDFVYIKSLDIVGKIKKNFLKIQFCLHMDSNIP